jgi:hypothetical protein
MQTNKNFFYKYQKYKLKYQNLLKQKAGSIDELRDCLREASEIFQIVNHYGEEDAIKFFITGSVGVLFYFIDFYDKYSHLLTDSEVKFIDDVCEYIKPNDLDIFWAELSPSSYELFDSKVFDILSKTKMDVRVGQQLSSSDSVKSSESATFRPGPISKPASLHGPPSFLKFGSATRDHNEENLKCIGNDELLVIGSHYSKVPVPDDSTFYKCIDKISRFTKIDFDRFRSNVNTTYITYGGMKIRILGINDLLGAYTNSFREKDDVKIGILQLICRKLNEKNEYIGHPVLNIHHEEEDYDM